LKRDLEKNMAKQWEITGRLGELQLAWLKAHYDEATLADALARLPKKGFPLNVAKRLEYAGGPRMPHPSILLADDPACAEELARIAAMSKGKSLP
jgi:hypothetical protein